MKPTIEHLREKPISVSLVQCERDRSGLIDSELTSELSLRVATPFFKTGYTVFRGVEVTRLPLVLRTGIDVEPMDSVFYGAEFDKALEYGGWPKLILALNGNRLTKTFKEVPAYASDDEIVAIRRSYPTMLKSADGKTLWFSRLNETDSRIASRYESDYAWWIEGDATSALKGLIVFCTYDDIDTCSHIRNMFADS